MAKPDKTRQKLSNQQLNAIELLVTGKTDREVAEVIGVSRQTVCGWRLYDPFFEADLNRRRKEVWGASVDKLRSLLPKALEVLERELDSGPNSWRAALKVVEMAGLTSAKAVGPDDPEVIIDAEARKLILPVPDDERGAVLADLAVKRREVS